MNRDVSVRLVLAIGVFLCGPSCTPSTKNALTSGEKPGEKKERAERPGNETPGGGRSGGAPGGGRRGGPQIVEAVSAEIKTVPTKVNLTTVLEGRKQVEVYPRVGGRIKEVYKATGQAVTKGTLLFSIDRAEPGESFLSVPVNSPISGNVAQWYLGEGEQVSQGEKVVLVVDDSALRAKLWLPVTDWQKMTSQTKVTLTIDEVSKEAKVTSIARAVEQGAGKGLVEVEVANPDGQWKSGYSATATLALAPTPRLLIPARALSLTNDGAYLFVVEGGKANRKKVEFTPYTADIVEIPKDSVPEGTLVIVSGTGRLSNGSPVKLTTEDKTPTDSEAARETKTP